jgi:RNA polymerase sigma factor (sigma-70 family)
MSGMNSGDTSIPGPGAFPTTLWGSLVSEAESKNSQAQARFRDLCKRYWRPIYVYILYSWRRSREEAKDLTQDFFVKLMEENVLGSYSPDRGRFRTFLKAVLNHFMLDVLRAGRRLKRGGDAAKVPLELDTASLDETLPSDRELSPEEAFDREWMSDLLTEAWEETRETLARQGKQISVTLFERCVIDPPPEGRPTRQALAEEFGLVEHDVQNHLASARRALRDALVRRVRESVSTDSELQDEIREIFSMFEP